MPWSQNHNPLHFWPLSTMSAAGFSLRASPACGGPPMMSRLLVCVGEFDERRFAPRPADESHAARQVPTSVAHGNVDGREARSG